MRHFRFLAISFHFIHGHDFVRNFFCGNILKQKQFLQFLFKVFLKMSLRRIVCLGFVLFALQIHGQQFGEGISIAKSGIKNPSSPIVADINNDDLLDIIILTRIPDAILWYQNIGNGEFAERAIIIEPSAQLLFIKTIDIDADGDLDIYGALRQFEETEIVYYENLGEGEFSNPQLNLLSGNVSDATIVDVDQDGALDLLVARDEALTIAKGGGVNLFGTVNALTFKESIAVQAHNMDDDPELELVTHVIHSTGNHGLVVYDLDDTASTFNSAYVLTSEESLALSDVIDLNSDGYQDILFSAGGLARVQWNDGAGNFTEEILQENIEDLLPKAVDLNHDNLYDVVIGSSFGFGAFDAFMNTGNGIFQHEVFAHTNFSSSVKYTFEDLDQNGQLEIICVGEAGDLIAFGPIDDQFNLGEFTYLESTMGGATSFLSLDIDLDGDQDFVLASVGIERLSLFINGGNAQFVEGTVNSTRRIKASKLIAVDVDADGIQDIVVYDAENKFIAWYRYNDGVLEFVEELFDSIQFLESADMNQDGLHDLFVVQEDNLLLFANDPNGNFSPSELVLENFIATKILFDDLDLDGDTDLILDNTFVPDSEGYYLRGTGGGFGNLETFSYGEDLINPLALIDVDQNGTVDLLGTGHLLANFPAMDIQVLYNGGSANFQDPTVFHDGLNAAPLLVEKLDYNGDGIFEFILGNIVRISELTLNIEDQFNETTLVDPLKFHLQIGIKDCNADGSPDFVILYNNADELMLYENIPGVPSSEFQDIRSDCFNQEFENTSHAFYPNTSILWKFGDGTTSEAIQPGIHEYSAAGNYLVELILCAELGCDTSSQIVPFRLPSYYIPDSGIPGQLLQFEDNSAFMTNWTWDFGDDISSLEQSPTHSYIAPGLYDLQFFVTDSTSSQCTHSEVVQIDINWPIGLETNKEELISISPNPCTDYLSFDSSELLEGISVYERGGKLCFKTGLQEKTINVSHLPSGNYVVEFQFLDGKRSFQKFSKF